MPPLSMVTWARVLESPGYALYGCCKDGSGGMWFDSMYCGMRWDGLCWDGMWVGLYTGFKHWQVFDGSGGMWLDAMCWHALTWDVVGRVSTVPPHKESPLQICHHVSLHFIAVSMCQCMSSCGAVCHCMAYASLLMN